MKSPFMLVIYCATLYTMVTQDMKESIQTCTSVGIMFDMSERNNL
jgi:hypothetical protein